MLWKSRETWQEKIRISKNEINVRNSNLVTDETIKHSWMQINRALKRHKWKGIEALKFEFHNCPNITAESLTISSTQAQKIFSTLKSVHFLATSCKDISSRDLKRFSCRGLESLNLKKAVFDFYGCRQFNDSIFKPLSRGIAAYLPNLQSLRLSFDYCNKITDQSMRRLGRGVLQFFAQMKDLKLSFQGNQSITDTGFAVLTKSICQYLKVLEHLSLTFGACNEITDKGLESFGREMENNLQSLQELKLDFGWCEGLGDLGYEAVVSKTIEHLLRLERLTLKFYGCRNITEKGLTQSVLFIKTFKGSLKILHFDFGNCAKLRESTKEDMKKELRYIPKLHFQ